MKNHKIISAAIFILSFAWIGIFAYLANTVDCWPRVSSFLCGDFSETKLQPLFWSALPLPVIAIGLFIFRREVFLTWAKFAVPAFIIMIGIMLYTYNNTPDVGGWVDWGSDDQFATLTLPPLFFIISVIIIARKARRLRHFDSKKSVPTF